MREETTWKGHTFTLMVFAGIAVLCSIFFVLGMLVGRAQGQKMASAAAATDPSKAGAPAEINEEGVDLTFYEEVKRDTRPAPEGAQLKPDPAPSKPAVTTEAIRPALPPPVAGSENAVHFQVGAFPKEAAAEKLLAAVKKKGFDGLILKPAADERNPFFRVQVGPYTPQEAQQARKKLESAGYRPILKK
jgi:cell division protein FtsN